VKGKTIAAMLVIMVVMVGCTSAGGSAPTEQVDLESLPVTIDVATVRALQDRSDVVMIDVREPYEFDAGHVADTTLIPMGEVPARLAEIPKDKTVVLVCRSGNRSGQVTEYLKGQGYSNIHNMEGGIVAWQAAGYPVNR
jgi:phage shock protein E